MAGLHDAMLWETREDGKLQCNLCGHRCVIAEDAFGFCNVRQNIGGKLKTHSYDKIITVHVDPIEKKPLAHFLPGSLSLSIATAGCNFRCDFCQNWRISQSPRSGSDERAGEAIPPEELVELAVRQGCASISYTYTEPTIFFELAYDTSIAAREKGLKNCFVSNGFMTPQAVETISPVLDAINVDLKAFRDETYRTVCGGRLQPVLDSLEALVAAGVWVEVTTLVVPGMNDSAEELGRIAEFIATRLGRGVPWHVGRFHGDYRMTHTPATPLATLESAVQLGREAGLKYIYCGNVPGRTDERTYCPACDKMLIDRDGFCVGRVEIVSGKCPACGEAIEGVWQ
jgi:pyruvate formate lyase activating enzyme